MLMCHHLCYEIDGSQFASVFSYLYICTLSCAGVKLTFKKLKHHLTLLTLQLYMVRTDTQHSFISEVTLQTCKVKVSMFKHDTNSSLLKKWEPDRSSFSIILNIDIMSTIESMLYICI